MHDVYELTSSMKLLLTMHHASAINLGSAKNLEELNMIADIPQGDMRGALEELVTYGYVVRSDKLYYLSNLGICVVRSVYT